MDLLTGKGPSKRREIFYFGGPNLGAVRIDDFKFTFFQQPYGWPGEKVTTDMPTMVNIRQDPFERTPNTRGESPNTGSFGYGNDFYAREFWRFVLVQQFVAKLALTAVDYPPMQDPASFNLDAVKKKIDEMAKHQAGQ
jgi:arylsulfatase